MGSREDRNGGNRQPEPRREQGRQRSRAAREKARRRRRTLLIFYMLTILTVVTAAVALSLTVLFQIDEIQVTGTSRYSKEEIVKACTVKTGENLFLADTGQAARVIEQKLPYIGSAKVSRRLPAKIVVAVTEAKVSGAVQYGDGYVVVAADGKALEKTDALPQGCPAILGLKLSSAEPGKKIAYEDENAKKIFNDLAATLEKNGLTQINTIDLTDQFRILVEYDGRITINLGLPSDFDYKIRFAKTILEREDMQESKGVLNLTNTVEDDRAYFDENAVISSSQPEPSSAPEGSTPEEGSPQPDSSQAE